MVVDQQKKRYDHMRARVASWAKLLARSDVPVYFKMLSLTYDTLGTVTDPRNWQANDIRNFELSMRKFLKQKFPGIVLYGYAWVSEIQPISKNYHYHLVLATSKRLHFSKGASGELWPHGFSKITVAQSPYYLVSYVKKQDQKDYFYFPFKARGFAVYIAKGVLAGAQSARLLLRFNSLKYWQVAEVLQHLEEDGFINLTRVKDARPPPSEWAYAGSTVTRGYADMKAAELEARYEWESLLEV